MVCVFVYGTLKPGEVNDWVYRQYAVQARPAVAQGHLYHLPLGYPALTEGGDRVYGVLLRFEKSAKLPNQLPDILPILDAFEQHDPEAFQRQAPGAVLSDCQYQRRAIAVMDEQGNSLGTAWVYSIAEAQVQRMGGVRLPRGIWPANNQE